MEMNENRQPQKAELAHVRIQTPMERSHPATAETEIDLLELFYLIWGHLWQAMLCLIVGGAVAFAYTYYFVAPTYQATAKIYMVSAAEDSLINLGDLNLGSSLATDYKEMMKVRPILEDVIRNLELDTSTDALSKQISINGASDSRLLNIVVTDTNPFRAADIANEMANQAVVYLPMFMECKAPNIAETALVPTKKAGPNITRNTMIGAMAGFVLYSGILILLYLMNDTLVTPEDVEKYLGVQPLATIPEGDLGSFSRNPKNKKKKKETKSEDTVIEGSEG